VIRLENMSEGHQLRRYYELKLDRREHPMFGLSWSLFHIIDETSPLYGLTPGDLTAMEAALVLNVSGVDDNSAQQLYARKIYPCEAIRWNHRYNDMTSLSPEGRLVLDYRLFHEVVPDGLTRGGAAPPLTEASEDAGSEQALSDSNLIS
jgi:inward rectifier potassium channel